MTGGMISETLKICVCEISPSSGSAFPRVDFRPSPVKHGTILESGRNSQRQADQFQLQNQLTHLESQIRQNALIENPVIQQVPVPVAVPEDRNPSLLEELDQQIQAGIQLQIEEEERTAASDAKALKSENEKLRLELAEARSKGELEESARKSIRLYPDSVKPGTALYEKAVEIGARLEKQGDARAQAS